MCMYGEEMVYVMSFVLIDMAPGREICTYRGSSPFILAAFRTGFCLISLSASLPFLFTLPLCATSTDMMNAFAVRQLDRLFFHDAVQRDGSSWWEWFCLLL